MEKIEEDFDYQVLEAIVTKMRDSASNLIITSFTTGEDAYNQRLSDLSQKLNVQYVDISKHFQDDRTSYHWKFDGHWNKKGHNQAALALYKELKSRLCQ